MFANLAVAALAITGSILARDTDSAATAQIRVDSLRREVIITAGPIHLPAATPYDHHLASAPIAFTWPVSGWARGYRVDLVDRDGRVLPREMLHHAGVANLDRRQVAYPLVERLFAAGRETPQVMLPASMGVPLSPDMRMLLYYALVNPTDVAVDDASLRVTIAWVPERAHGPNNVLPLSLDAFTSDNGGSTFDVPTGVSVTTSEFTLPVGGRVRQLGGHLHDYAVELRLEDVQSGRVLARLGADRNADGTIRGVSRARFLFHPGGLRLEANRRYRVVGVYDNPTCATVGGAMAFIAGPFVPDDVRRVPSVDLTNPIFRQDLALLASGGQAAEHDHASMQHAEHGEHMQVAPRPMAPACSRGP